MPDGLKRYQIAAVSLHHAMTQWRACLLLVTVFTSVYCSSQHAPPHIVFKQDFSSVGELVNAAWANERILGVVSDQGTVVLVSFPESIVLRLNSQIPTVHGFALSMNADLAGIAAASEAVVLNVAVKPSFKETITGTSLAVGFGKANRVNIVKPNELVSLTRRGHRYIPSQSLQIPQLTFGAISTDGNYAAGIDAKGSLKTWRFGDSIAAVCTAKPIGFTHNFVLSSKGTVYFAIGKGLG